ncbi:patatin-like phospholipase family protein [Actinomycetospora lemnae]|uniref:Patatin-like phospholipase family protein n=1 Tax=Actinomycetospora lemnae TaxID=3019891 RepID=A0ABT5SWN8_9PSEU|nr:patatin-like phospholipase family protein [Actinomycetospora sp. DW7H6]MDD7967174.1 patatin-like phospholipase family protein [Actinomycetospora sp. DW7H6]
MTVDFPHLLPQSALLPSERARAFAAVAAPRQLVVDGVFEGGGALGTGYVGALRALEDNGIGFARVAGNSAGAITAAMVAAGFSAREIQWLSSAFPGAPSGPATLTQRGITEPIPFPDFLDLPAADTVARSSIRRTQLWHALNGSVLDVIGDIPLPIPARRELRDACVQAIVGLPLIGGLVGAGRAALEAALDVVLFPVPADPPRVGDFLPDTAPLRRDFADTVWDAVAAQQPLQYLLTNLVHEGSLFEGAQFTRIVGELLSRKVHDDPAKPVQFRHLPVPLAVIAADIDQGTMTVYSSRTNPRMKVIDAVRRSMSIPFVFEPQGPQRQIVDGGLCSNFPLFLFAGGSERFWPDGTADDDRVKIGLSLDEAAEAPAAWGAGPARFETAGSPPRVDTLEVLRPILAAGLEKLGYPAAVVALDLADALGTDGGGNPSVELLHQIAGVVQRGVLNTEQSTREALTTALMADRTYVDISVPLLGYHVLDFYVNTAEAPLVAMWDRGWRAAIEPLSAARDAGALGGTPISRTTSPFH